MLPDDDELIAEPAPKAAPTPAPAQHAPAPIEPIDSPKREALARAMEAIAQPAAAPDPAPAPAAAVKPLSPLRALAAYLTALRQVVDEATESRRAWVRQIGILMQDTRSRPLAMVTPQAGKIGAEQRTAFQTIRGKLEALRPPTQAVDCHTLLNTWLDKHIAACQTLVEFGGTGDIAKIRAVQGLLAEGRVDMERFQAEYGRQVTHLKKQVEAARKKRRRWPFAKASRGG